MIPLIFEMMPGISDLSAILESQRAYIYLFKEVIISGDKLDFPAGVET
jgi:hypothetical protein